MKGLAFILISALLLLPSSNTLENNPAVMLEAKNQIVFFSDDSNFQRENPYYDALIELKKEFPKEIKNMVILSSAQAQSYSDTFKVEHSPAIVVLNQKEIVFCIKGEASKEQIMQPMAKALSEERQP